MQTEKIAESSGKEGNAKTASETASPTSPPASKIIPLPGATSGENDNSSTESSSGNTKYQRTWFDYKGRSYRIQKRSDSKKAAWYLAFEYNKERYYQSLHSAEKVTAIANAKIKIDAILGGLRDLLRMTLHGGGKPQYSTIGEVLTWFEAHAQDVGDVTAKAYANTLKNVLRQVFPGADVLQLKTEVLSKTTVRAYFDAALAEAKLAPNQAEANRIKRTANSTLNQAKAIFSERRIEDMKEDGLILPDMKPFLLACKTRKFEGVLKKDFRMPSDAIVKATLDSWLKLEDRNVFVAAGLALSCGLRMSEIEQALGNWVTEIDGQPHLVGVADVKGGTAEVFVRPIDPYWRQMWERIAAMGWQVKPEERLLTGSNNEVYEEVERRLSEWMSGLGWQTQKKAHALRAYAGGLVALRYGIRAAQTFLRHSTVKTTEDSYLYLIKPESRTIAPEKVGVQWAEKPNNQAEPLPPDSEGGRH